MIFLPIAVFFIMQFETFCRRKRELSTRESLTLSMLSVNDDVYFREISDLDCDELEKSKAFLEK